MNKPIAMDVAWITSEDTDATRLCSAALSLGINVKELLSQAITACIASYANPKPSTTDTATPVKARPITPKPPTKPKRKGKTSKGMKAGPSDKRRIKSKRCNYCDKAITPQGVYPHERHCPDNPNRVSTKKSRK